MLPQITQAIGVPFGALLSVQVEPGPSQTIVLPAPALPVPTERAFWDPQLAPDRAPVPPKPTLTIEEDPAIYSASASYPGKLAEIVSDGVVRQQRVAGIAVHPVQYWPATRELTVYEWLRVTVVFSGSSSAKNLLPAAITQSTAPESGAFEKVLEEGLLNYEAARAWRQTPHESQSLAVGIEGGSTAALAETESLPWAPPVPSWRIEVRDEGFYKLTYAELQTAGLPVATLDPRTFRLYNLGSEVAIFVTGEQDGHFDSSDVALFYGRPFATKYTRDNVYWLTYGQGTGLRMGSRSGAPGTAGVPPYYSARRHLETNAYYTSKAPGDNNLERWMWDYVYPPNIPSRTFNFSLAGPYDGTYAARLKVAMLGYLNNALNPDHHASISLNGTQVADVRWDGISWQNVDVPIAQNLLRAGNNTLTVTCSNGAGTPNDIVYVDWAELEFANTFVSEGDVLPFSYAAAGPWKFQVGGFSNGQVVVYDVTDPAAVTQIVGIDVVQSGQTYTARFQDPVAAPTGYIAMTTTAYRTVLSIEADAASNLASAQNAADYILITPRAFWSQGTTLRNFRASLGLRAVQVDLQDVYDEFGYGIVAPAAIHDFLAYAYANWVSPAPSFVLLVGDGHYDPMNYAGYGRASYLPPYLGAVDPWIIETAADNRYVTLVGSDTLPDMMLGRLAVNSSAEASAFVTKILAYEQSPEPGDWRQQVLAIADNADYAGNFAQLSDNLLSCCLPATYQAEKVYYGVTHPTVAAVKSAILAAINSGKLIVNYIGHAGVSVWAEEPLFSTGDVPGLTNGGRLPILLPMTCYDGYYHYPFLPGNYDAMAEVFTRAGGKGAVASWSPTGLGIATGHDYLNRGFFRTALGGSQATLGEATQAGKLDLWTAGISPDLLDTYLLFGDPAMYIAAPSSGITPTPTRTRTPTASPTATATSTPTPTATGTRTPTATLTSTPTATRTATVTPTQMPTSTGTPTATQTATATSTQTSTATVTPTPTATMTNSPTATPTATMTNSPTATPTATLTSTQTPTSTSTPTATQTATATSTQTSTATMTNPPTATPTATVTSTQTATGTSTPTATAATATSTQTPTATVSPTRTATMSPTASSTPTPTITRTPKRSTATSTATGTPTPSGTPLATATATATATPTLTSTPTATAANLKQRVYLPLQLNGSEVAPGPSGAQRGSTGGG